MSICKIKSNTIHIAFNYAFHQFHFKNGKSLKSIRSYSETKQVIILYTYVQWMDKITSTPELTHNIC